MLLKNFSPDTVVIAELGAVIPPGGKLEVPDGYCYPRPVVSGHKLACIMKMLCPQLKPADESLHQAWESNTMTAPPEPPARPEMTGMATAAAAMAEAGLVDTVASAKAKKLTPKEMAQKAAEAQAKTVTSTTVIPPSLIDPTKA